MKRGRECRFDLQPYPDPEKLVFVDETGTSTEMARLHGRAPRGDGAGLRLLPPYSPDFNPIGMAFSKIRAWLKNAAPRTVGICGTPSPKQSTA